MLVDYFVKRFAENGEANPEDRQEYTRALQEISLAGQCSGVAEHRRAMRDPL
jgi:hypothetical protein